jgi:two-component system CheB/CheR fusion protein
LRELTEQTLLNQIASAAMLVNVKGDILYVHGRTGMYLEPAPGETGVNNILKMAREGLRRALTMALHKAVRARETVRCPGLRVKTNGDLTTVNLTIRPVVTDLPVVSVAGRPVKAPESPLYLVILEQAQIFCTDAQSAPVLQSIEGVDSTESETDVRIVVLNQELRAKEEYLQTANEELETSNEELKSSNEEMQSVNEELQSTNEELETSKEELQSVNEELATVNAELQSKVADLSRANNDMNNLLAGTGIATVFVDHGLRILRFTPAATQIINLILSDVGRPVGHIVSNLIGYDRMVPDAQSVLNTLVPKDVEVQTAEHSWYTMRIRPYRTLENVIEGAVITFFDITEMKRIEESLRETDKMFKCLFENVFNAVSIHEIILDAQGKPVDYVFLQANPAFEKYTGLIVADIIGRRAMQVYPGIEKTDLIEIYGNVALTGVPASFETFFEPTQRHHSINCFNVGKGRFAVTLGDGH